MFTKKLATILVLACMLVCLFPADAHAGDVYMPCVICNGSAKCGLCDPASGSDHLGDGWQKCIYCNQTGYIKCGTNHTGDGTPIGCDGSGYKPDGSVCEVCGGEGKYPCDVCYGSGVFECECRQMGQPGKCTVCYGTGWWLSDGAGHQINTSPVYPPDGATIDAGTWGRHELYSYDASRFGTGTTPYQGMARVGAKTIDQFYKALRGADFTGDSGSSGDTGGSGQNSQGGQSSGGQSSQGGGQDQTPDPDNSEGQPAPDDHGGEDEHGPDEQDHGPGFDMSFYDVEIRSDEDIRIQIASNDDMIYFINRRIGGNYLFTVQAVKSQLSPSELEKLKAMSEADIAAFKNDLEAAANGFQYYLDRRYDLPEGVDVYLEFEFGQSHRFPVPCDVLLELPLKPGHGPADIYLVQDDLCYKLPLRAIDVAGDRELLIFSTDRLGSFLLTNADVNDSGTPPEAGPLEVETAPEDPEPPVESKPEPGTEDSEPVVTIGATEPAESAKPMSGIVIAVIAGVALGAAIAIIALKKKH